MATIFGFGDSIIFGSWDDEMGGWMNRLRLFTMAKVKDDNSPITRIYNLGIPGETTSQLINRVQTDLVGRITNGTNIFIVASGMNDLAYIISENRFVVDLNTFSENLKNLIALLRKYDNAKIVFLTITPVNEEIAIKREGKNTSRINQYVENYNEELIKVCDSFSVPVIDVYNPFINNNHKLLIDTDGVHPNASGHELLYSTVKEYFENKQWI